MNSEITANRRLVNHKRMDATAKEALSKIGHEIDLDAKMGDLSVADKQLIAICRALLFNAKLIIMDEPTTALTKKEVDALFKTVRELRDTGIAIHVHQPQDRRDLRNRGRCRDHAQRQKCLPWYHRRYYPQTIYVLYDRPRTHGGHFIPKNISKDPVLEVKDLSLEGKYQDVSFELRKGEILGITGLWVPAVRNWPCRCSGSASRPAVKFSQRQESAVYRPRLWRRNCISVTCRKTV